MGFGEIIVALIAMGGLISLFAIYLDYKSKGVPVIGSARMRGREAERLEQEIQALSDRVAAVEDKCDGIREQLADVILDSHPRAPALDASSDDSSDKTS